MISCVKWKDVCKPKEIGGIGIKDLKVFNETLMIRWKWKMLANLNQLWVRIIKSKYGSYLLQDPSYTMGRKALRWWKDLTSITTRANAWWFMERLKRKVDNRNDMRF
ncbi:hypothetical protein VNO77_33278 [Canavalia gladiata]|uniref:RNA-directed DNA polymerase, eukaryota, reverse transcriptase zinc-binding domain protein n=1 Tax=Canavalia gladiata TaxID=3824 RepID=A0AAN9PW84_CANGL